MCRGNVDMRWQFGGNFQPIRVICEEDWKNCPIAVLNYVWSEVVTEVVDCLSNDVLVWKIIAIVVAFIMLIHTVYYKLRWIDETSVNRENLNKVGFKVQDLELKVNILTYKMQYGTWPLPHHMRNSEVGNELHDVRLTLSNSDDRNSWIKHLLLSPRKNKEYTLCKKNLVHSVKSITKLLNLETKYVSSKFQNDISPIESGNKTPRSSYDNSTRKWKRCKKCFDMTLSKQKQISKSENLGLRRRQSPKSISLLKKDKYDSQVISSNINSNETFIVKKESEISCSESTCSGRNLHGDNQLRRDSNELIEKNDINHNVECHLEKLENSKMERSIETKNLELNVNSDSRNEIQKSTKSTDDTFYSWSDCDTNNTQQNEISNFQPNLNISFLTETFQKSPSFDKPAESLYGGSTRRRFSTTTQETLNQVRDELESLHDILLTYDSIDGNQNECNSIIKDCIFYKDTKSIKPSKVSFEMDIKENLITEEEILNSSEYEQCESIIQSSATSLSVQSYSNIFRIHREVVAQNSNSNRFDHSESESGDDKTQIVLENSSNVSINTFTKVKFESKENLTELKSDFTSISHNVNCDGDRITSHNSNYIMDHKMTENHVLMDTSEDQSSLSSSQVELSNDETSDNQSTSALLQEALQFKDALVSQLEWERESKMNQKNIRKEEEDEYDFRKNSWPKVDNYFQTKVLDIITEEQSASSSTEKTSKTFVMLKMSEKQDLPQHQRKDENAKSVLASTSSEYFSFSNLSQSDKETRNKRQTEPGNKRVMNNEINPNDSIKRSKYMIPKEKDDKLNEEKENEESSVNNKQIENFKEEKVKQDKLREEKEVENQNLTSLSPVIDSSSDESLMQFIKELATDKVKAAKIFRELKLNSNAAKSKEKSSNENEEQEQENAVTLQRRPGSFSLAEDEFREKSLKVSDCDSSPDLQVTNLEKEVILNSISMEINTDFTIVEKMEECEFEKKEHVIDNNMNEKDNNFENNNTDSNFYLDDIESNYKAGGDNFREDSLKEKKSEESIIKVSETKCEFEEFQNSSERKKNEFSLRKESSESLVSQEKVDKSQSNLTFDPSSSLYFTAGASNSDIKLNVSVSISKTNLEDHETIFEDANETLSENKIYENNYEKMDENPTLKEEVMLIDLSDNDSSEKKLEIEEPEIFREICNDSNHSEDENLNILDTTLEGKIEESICLIPNKIQSTNKSDTTFNNSSETGSFAEAKEGGINIIEKSTLNQLKNKMKITEMNKFSHCPSAPSLQHLLCSARKSSSVNSSSSLKSKQKIETTVKAKSLVKSVGSREKSVDNSKENRPKRDLSKEKEPKVKSYSNLNKQSAGDHSQRRSRSFVSPRSSNNLNHEERIKSARDYVKSPMEMDQQVKFTSRTSIKSVESQQSSRSCIPILKSRLDNIRKPGQRSRTRSPVRGPLTISPRPDNRDLKNTSDFYAKEEGKEEKNDCNEKSFGDNTGTEMKNSAQGSKEKTVIYVNIMTDQDQSRRKVIDPKKFLEFVKDHEFKFENIINKEMDEINPIVENNSRDLKKKFSFQVEQKEREVSVKPSVMDNSTSVSDFPEFCDNGKQEKNKFKIFQVPEELTKEEYINLLDSLNQDPNLKQLKKMHDLCSKLGLGFQE